MRDAVEWVVDHPEYGYDDRNELVREAVRRLLLDIGYYQRRFGEGGED